MRQPVRPIRWLAIILSVYLGAAAAPAAQQTAKRPVTHDVYDSWTSIQGTKLSRDGAWLVYTLAPQDGDGELVVRNLRTGVERRQARGRDAVITADDRFVVYTIAPVKADVDKAKKDKKKPEEQPKPGLGVLNLATGEIFSADRVKSFKLPEESGAFVAYLLEAPEKKAEPEKKDAEARKEEPKKEGETAKPAEKPRTKEKKKDAGTDLVVRDLSTGAQVTVAEVTEYAWPKDGSWLGYAVSSAVKTPEKDGAFARRSSDGVTKALLTGLGHYKSLAFDEKATQVAFLADRDTYKDDPATFKLYHWLATADAATEIAAKTTKGLPDGMSISENGAPEFSKDGTKLFFGYAKLPPPEPPEDAPELIKVDIWNYKDAELQPMQKVRAEAEKKRNYRAVIQLKDKRLVALASPDMPTVQMTEDASRVLGVSDVPYRQLVSWDKAYWDYYLVDIQDGSRQKFLEKSPFSASLSPGGNYASFFDPASHNWFLYRIADGKKVNLTEKLTVKWEDEGWDTPDLPRPYGIAGWTEGDKSVLIYDRFDVWEIQPDGTSARMITKGLGRAQQLVFRYQRLDPEERTIPLAQPVLLRTTDDRTKASGFYRTSFTTAEPVKIVMLDKLVGPPTKAKNADVLVLTASRFEEFGNLWVTNGNFENLTKVSDANPQQSQFVWGRSELIDYRNTDGRVLRAILTKPDNFDPAKKYPLMVYIYEGLTDGLHRYVAPSPGTSINATRYVSNGYILLQPDIEYDTGYPGESAMKCVIPAVQQVVSMGFIDPARIGIQGHSWGGYQITYMITRTNMFRAVEAGASVSNMTSAYGGIRWGSGMSRAFQYERTQSRIGAPPWSRPLQFIENSPLFWVEKVNTPYLTIANDEDDAVPWYQGIEFFSAMRRLGKEAYMFNYNTEKHGLRERENQKHWTVHMTEFFDHYLLGAPLPAWMDEGVPYLERGKRDVSGFYKRPGETKELKK